jgi:cytochrome c oxidase subunit III
MLISSAALPADRRAQQGGLLFLTSLLMFFLASLILYFLYAHWRQNDPYTATPLPRSLLLSTVCLVGISGTLHAATRAVRRERRGPLVVWLVVSIAAALLFLAVQLHALWGMLLAPGMLGTGTRGLVGMVAALAVLHALHVAGGVIALALVTARAALGRYDHERYWAVDFTALYWHFLDVIWLCMLGSFWMTTGGF